MCSYFKNEAQPPGPQNPRTPSLTDAYSCVTALFSPSSSAPSLQRHFCLEAADAASDARLGPTLAALPLLVQPASAALPWQPCRDDDDIPTTPTPAGPPLLIHAHLND